MDRLEIERLIGEVAKRHNVLLSRDDPILVTVTLNEQIVARALQRLEAALTGAEQQIAAGTSQQVEMAKSIASRLITAAADYVGGQIRASAEEVAARMQTAVAAELRGAQAAAKSSQQAQVMAWWAVAAVIAVAAIIGTTLALYPLRIEVSACRSGQMSITTSPCRAAVRCPNPAPPIVTARGYLLDEAVMKDAR